MTNIILRQGISTPLSQVVIYNGTAYVSGQVDHGMSKTATEQTQHILAQLDQLLASAGADRTCLLLANVWLSDMEDFATFNEVWISWLDGSPPPARATVQAPLADERFKVEISVIAALNSAAMNGQGA